jgi:serine/threonine protein kinase
MKLKVQPQFAGRSSRCPACKQPVVVPLTDKTVAVAPDGEIDGTSSSLAQAQVEGGVTLPPSTALKHDQRSVLDVLARQSKKGQRYVVEREIARGGMGAVLRAVDSDIRREVAIKYLLDQSDPGKKARFIEEAQITGQLEHPNIVPIHELGIDAKKRLFFAMKMVKGRSLAQVLDELRSDPKAAEKAYSLGRLLAIFVNVCHALAYAHSRGVVHRDLKPANIMIGDFGEVYVMDWGLAKVLKHEPAAPAREETPSIVGATGSQVLTSREIDADLTQEGAVLGTPVYMAPEQATGRVNEIDARSDVYALGAILYELLTLQPPIDKEGGYLAILMRVAAGEIVPPEQRAPERAKAGKVPRELAAVARKAMALRPPDRYASVEALRRDIERFLEGRSVSAKEDTLREMAWRLVRRNKAISIVSTAALVLIAFVWGRSAWISHEEQTRRREQTAKAVPAFLEAARFAVQSKKFDDALAQVNVAAEYDPDNVAAHLLRGQLLIAHKKDFTGARAELEQYLQRRPEDAEVQKLIELCRKAHSDDPASLASFVSVLMKQNELALAAHMVRSRDELLALYRQRLNAAWPSSGEMLQVDSDGRFTLQLTGVRGMVTDLSPLRGIPLTRINLGECANLKDLEPLQGMPLTEIQGYGLVQVTDLTPLRGMPLTVLNLAQGQHVNDLAPLQGMPLTWLSIFNSRVTDLAPLKGMKLTYLDITGCVRISDISLLHSMPLRELRMGQLRTITDLTPLEGLKLDVLHIEQCSHIRDLTPLQGMRLTELSMIACGATDVTPVASQPLRTLFLSPRLIKRGMDELRQSKTLKTIGVDVIAKTQWPAAEFWQLYDAGKFGK